MFDAKIADLIGLSKDEIRRQLAVSSARFRLRLRAPLYEANTQSQLADEWLALWYLGERLAACSRSASVYFRRADHLGNGSVTFTFHHVESAPMAESLEELVPGYDEDDLEGTAMHLQAAHAWLETRTDVPARLPDLELAFRGEAEEAREYEGYGSDDPLEDGDE